MPVNYTGNIKGFQVITRDRDPITVKSISANDVINILENFLEYYGIEKLITTIDNLEEHKLAVSENVHKIHLLTLGMQMLEQLYENWSDLGNDDTFPNFVYVFYSFIETAKTDPEYLGDSPALVLTVKGFYRLLHLFHTGIVYAHPPILDHIKSGTVVSNIPFISLEDITDPFTKLYPSNNESIYLSEGIDHILTYLTYNTNYEDQVLFFDFLHEILYKSQIITLADITKLDYLLDILYPSWKAVLNGADTAYITEFVYGGTLIGDLTDPAVLNVRFEYGTWSFKIELVPITQPVYYLTIFKTLETNWIGFDTLTPPETAGYSDPGIAVFRHPDDPLNVHIRFSSGSSVNQITCPISLTKGNLAFTYNRDTIKYGYVAEGDYIFQDIVRNPFIFNGQRVTISNVKNIQYYLEQINESQLTYLLT